MIGSIINVFILPTLVNLCQVLDQYLANTQSLRLDSSKEQKNWIVCLVWDLKTKTDIITLDKVKVK